MKDEEHTPTLELDYGQFLNWVAQDDWIAKRKKCCAVNALIIMIMILASIALSS